MNAVEHLGKVVRLGKGEPKHDPRTLRMARYLTDLPPAPPVRRWSTIVQSWPMFLNDMIGDCTAASRGHLQICWAANNGSAWRPNDRQILEAYMGSSGYDPDVGDSTDNGDTMLSALNHWRKFGVGGHKIDAFVALDIHSRDHFKAAINLFGGVYLGVSLPESARNQATWKVSLAGTEASAERGSWGGHAVAALDYDDDGQDNDDGLWIVTWGGMQKITWRWMEAYVDEAYCVLSPDWADADGAPSGFDYDGLKADLSRVAS